MRLKVSVVLTGLDFFLVCFDDSQTGFFLRPVPISSSMQYKKGNNLLYFPIKNNFQKLGLPFKTMTINEVKWCNDR